MNRITRLTIAITIATAIIIWSLYSPFSPPEVNRVMRASTGVRVLSGVTWTMSVVVTLRILQLISPRSSRR